MPDGDATSVAGEFGSGSSATSSSRSLAWSLTAFHTLVVVFADRKPGTGPTEPTRYFDSTVAEWGLVGGEKYKVGLSQSAFFAGSMIGELWLIFFPPHSLRLASWPLSDSFLRRKGAVTLTSSINDVSGLATAFSPAFPSTRLRFVTALHGGLGVSVFTLTTKRRLLRSSCHVAMCTFLFFALGSILLSLASLSTPSWRSLYIISSVPSVIFVIVVVPFIAESPRWHLVHGDVTAAMATMRSIAKTNGKDLPDNVFLALDDRKAAQENKKDAARSTIIDVIRSQVTGPRSPLSSSSTFHSIAYYGLTAECQNLRHGPAHSVDLNAAAEMPPTP
ncbi:organic cation/carnitine transporter 4-like [Asparagus officinalis]|uniref:organic cation/carnitine transporter 4-like n=1 Tax=Asparagus officinalis TaxID=4686 RepID=UPI00098E5D74|nr:organic cation/carnitine transporter 4-like [Asparagus officinalis]